MASTASHLAWQIARRSTGDTNSASWTGQKPEKTLTNFPVALSKTRFALTSKPSSPVPRHRRAVRWRDAATYDLAQADTSTDDRRAATDGEAGHRPLLLLVRHRQPLRVQLDRAARQLVRAVRGAVHVVPGSWELVWGRYY